MVAFLKYVVAVVLSCICVAFVAPYVHLPGTLAEVGLLLILVYLFNLVINLLLP